jgi:hypothetical protein
MVSAEAGSERETLYLFLDESGNYDFSPRGTKYLCFTCVSTTSPHLYITDLYDLKHKLIRENSIYFTGDYEYFHASEDKQVVRDEVYGLLKPCAHFSVDTVLVEKRKANPTIQEISVLYPKVYEVLIGYVLKQHSMASFSDLIIVIDALATNKKRKTTEKALKKSIVDLIQPRKPCKILHHQSKSHMYLQVTDYCSWAVYVKWERQELRPYNMIRDKVRSEFDIFSIGTTIYY